MMAPAQAQKHVVQEPVEASSDDEPLEKRFSRMLGKPLPKSEPIFGEDKVMSRELERLEKILAFEAEEARKEAEREAKREAKRAAKEARRAAREAKRKAKKQKRLEEQRPPVAADPQRRPASKVLSFLRKS
jgi:hypothetical protein